jgi:hypothetical protein
VSRRSPSGVNLQQLTVTGQVREERRGRAEQKKFQAVVDLFKKYSTQ